MYKIKTKVDGSVDCFKARLEAKGFNQYDGISVDCFKARLVATLYHSYSKMTRFTVGCTECSFTWCVERGCLYESAPGYVDSHLPTRAQTTQVLVWS